MAYRSVDEANLSISSYLEACDHVIITGGQAYNPKKRTAVAKLAVLDADDLQQFQQLEKGLVIKAIEPLGVMSPIAFHIQFMQGRQLLHAFGVVELLWLRAIGEQQHGDLMLANPQILQSLL